MSTWQGGFTNEVATILPGSVGSTELADGAVTSVKLANDIQSDNYVPGVSGWRIRRNTGDVEFGSGTFRGSIIATSGELGTLDVTGNIFLTSGDIITLKNPGTNDAWLEISSSSEGRLQWIKRFAGPTDLPMAELGLDASGTLSMLSNSQFGFAQGSATSPGITFRLDQDTGIYQPAANQIGFTTAGVVRVRIGTGHLQTGNAGTGTAAILVNGVGNASSPSYTWAGDSDTGMYRSSANTVDFATGGVRRLAISQGHGVAFGASGTSSADEVFRWDGTAKWFMIHDLFPDIGNHEVLRANRGAGTQTTPIGYFSSWISDPITGKRRKVKIIDLAEADVWKREWFEQIRPVFFKRVSTGQHEIGFALDHFREVDDNLKYLTTKGDEWGNSPDEFALLAVTIDYVQHLEQRVAELERKVAA